ncbi:MAG: copper resistance protein CopC [Acidimicrobiales bacterium]
MLGIAVVLVVLGLGATPAAAHAELVSTEPSSGQVVDAPPGQVVLHFSEGVDPPGDAIEVFDSAGDQLDVGDVTQGDGGRDVLVALPEIDDGAYVVTWRVSSADGHPIRGGFTFRVGEAGDDAEAEALMEELIAGEGGDSTVGVVYGVVRFLAFVGMVLLVGGALFLMVLWPQGGGDRRIRQLLGGGWLVVLVATILSFGMQATYAAGESLGSAVDGDLIGDVLDTRVGRVWLLRLVLLAVVLVAARWLLPREAAPGPAGDRDGASVGGADGDGDGSIEADASGDGWRGLPARWRADRARLAAIGGLGVALLATISLAGHAGAGDLVPLALLVDVVHLAAVSFWLGGLVFLLVAVLRRPVGDAATDDSRLEAVVGGFSTLAFAAVVTIVVTGTVQGVRQIQGVTALFDTTYGRVLIVKVLTFAVLVAVAAVSRSWVRRRWGSAAVQSAAIAAPATVAGVGPGAKAVGAPPDSPATDDEGGRPGLPMLRRSVGAEAGIAAVVLAITALLVNTVPAVDDYAPTYSAELHGDALLVQVEIDPAATGLTDVTVQTLSHAGEPLAVEEVTATLSLPSRDIGPIPLALEPAAATGRYVAPDTDIPLSGTWELVVAARLSQFEENEVTMSVAIR